MGAGMSVERTFSAAQIDVKTKFAQDMKRLTSAAAKLRIHSSKRKGEKEKKEKQLKQQQQEKEEKTKCDQSEQVRPESVTCKETMIGRSGNAVVVPQSTNEKPRLPPDVIAVTRVVKEKKWPISDLLHCLGLYVLEQAEDLSVKPSVHDIVSWITHADRALQLNGWTVNCFLLESHVIFTYMLLQFAFRRFTVKTITDIKELVLMCLYISYTYNANEISYPLRPFLVKTDRVNFWSKCTELSLSVSRDMLRLNQEKSFYMSHLTSLKAVVLPYLKQ